MARKTAKVTSILNDIRDLKRLEKARTTKAAVLIGSIKARGGDIKHDRVEIANVFADFYRELYENAHQVLDNAGITTRMDHNAIDIITKDEVADRVRRMKRDKGADDDGIFADIVMHGGEYIYEELASIFNDVLKQLAPVRNYWKSS